MKRNQKSCKEKVRLDCVLTVVYTLQGLFSGRTIRSYAEDRTF